MHEYSVAQSLLELIEQKADENQAKVVSSITVQIGRLSGIEPELLKTAFDAVKIDSIAKQAELILDVRDVRIQCNRCEKKSVLEDILFICPECGSVDLTTLEGEGMFLQTLKLET